jgi:hypothetical protein
VKLPHIWPSYFDFSTKRNFYQLPYEMNYKTLLQSTIPPIHHTKIELLPKGAIAFVQAKMKKKNPHYGTTFCNG